MKNYLFMIVFVSVIVSQAAMASESLQRTTPVQAEECTLFIDSMGLMDESLLEKTARDRGYRIVQNQEDAEFTLDVSLSQELGCGQGTWLDHVMEDFSGGYVTTRFSGRMSDGVFIENSERNEIHATFVAFNRINTRRSLRRVIPYCVSQN